MNRFALILLAGLLAACQPAAEAPPLEAVGVEITRPMPGRSMSAGYLTLRNNTDEAISITGARSPQFGSVEIHETTVEDGVSRMRELSSLDIPAGGEVVLERGGKHLMLMRAEDNLESVSIELLNNDTPVLTLNVSVGTP